MRARDAMTPDPRFVTLDGTVSEAASIMRDVDVGLVPVVEDAESRRLEGVITDRDIAVRHVAERHTDDCTVEAHMSRDLTTASPDDDTDDVMGHMRRHQVRRIPVVEDGSRLVGILAQADLAVKLGSERTEEVEETVEAISEPAEPDR